MLFFIIILLLAIAVLVSIILKQKKATEDPANEAINRAARTWNNASHESRSMLLYAMEGISAKDVDQSLSLTWNQLPAQIQVRLAALIEVEHSRQNRGW